MSNDEYHEICSLVSEFICNNFPSARNHEVKLTDNLIETGMVDSLGFLIIVEFVEDEFDIMLSGKDMGVENFGSIEAIAKFVFSKK